MYTVYKYNPKNNITIAHVLWLVKEDIVLLVKYTHDPIKYNSEWFKPNNLYNEPDWNKLSRLIETHELTTDQYEIIKTYDNIEEFQADYLPDFL
jgi:hypothetical protein